MASVYILFSSSANKFYVGCTKDIGLRLELHLKKVFANSFTAKHNDCELYFEIPDLSITQARKIEAHIKKMKSKIYIQNLKKYPEMVLKLIEQYK